MNFTLDTSYEIFGNTVGSYLYAFALFLGLSLAFKILQSILFSRLRRLSKKTKTDIDDTLIDIVASIRPSFYLFLSFYLSFKTLNFTEFVNKLLSGAIIVWVTYQVIIAVNILIDYALHKKLNKEDDKETETAIETLTKVARGVVWVIGVLIVLQNMGLNITSLIAGLGIGGVAVALAAQNILGDLFSSFAILLDKPFVKGDFIVAGEHKGTIERIGIKTTRLRALQGEEIVISNNELTSTRIQNFKKMKERRVVFTFGVTYQTTSKQLKDIQTMLKKIITDEKKTKFDRAHFTEFADSALVFEAVYFVKTADYAEFRDIHQRILLAIKDQTEKAKIEMAYPTQTIYLEK